MGFRQGLMIPERSPEDYYPQPDCISLPVREVLAGERRLDGEVYLSEGFLLRQDIHASGLPSESLGNLAVVWQPPRLKAVKVGQEHGEPYLAATQVFDIWPTPRKWLAKSKTPEIGSLLVQLDWILVTRSGTVGLPIMTYAPHLDKVISDDLLRVQVREASFRGYLYTFLRTRYGRALMRSSHYGNVIKHLETQHLEEVPVPIVGDLVDELAGDVGEIFRMRDEAYALDMQAREQLSDAFGSPAEPGPEIGYSVSSGDLHSGRRRLEAYAHNPLVLVAQQTVRAKAKRIDKLEQVASPFLPSRFRRVYGQAGIPFWGSEDVFKVNPEVTKRLTAATPVDLDDYRVEANWLLMARSGQIYGMNGSVILATARHEDVLVSEHIMRIVPDEKRIRPGYLQAVLSHPEIGQPLVLSRAYGTSIPELAPVDVADVPVARLPDTLENEIADAVKKAGRLRMEADDKEDGAVAKLEEALEAAIGKPRRHKKLRLDVAETAHRVMLEATGQAPRTVPPHARGAEEKNPEAVDRGKKGGRPKRAAGDG